MTLEHGAFYWRRYVEGKQKRIMLGRSFAEAIVEYGKLEAQKAEPKKTMKWLIERFLADKRQPRAIATQKNYETWGKQLIAGFGHLMPYQVQGHHAAKLLDEHPKRVTAQRLVGLLSNVLGYGVRIGAMPGPNPLYGFDKGPKSRRLRYITDAEWAAILESAQPWLALMLRMKYKTALRIADLLRIRLADVRDDGLHVGIQKTRDSIGALVLDRDAEMNDILDGLKQLRRRVVGMYLFSTRHGKPRHYSVVRKAFKEACEQAGCPDVTLHDVRRKRITDIEKTHGLQLAQRVAAHTDPRTTQGYIVNQELRVSLPSVAR